MNTQPNFQPEKLLGDVYLEKDDLKFKSSRAYASIFKSGGLRLGDRLRECFSGMTWDKQVSDPFDTLTIARMHVAKGLYENLETALEDLPRVFEHNFVTHEGTATDHYFHWVEQKSALQQNDPMKSTYVLKHKC